jgi:short-chain Z-isoprenyl diphosphate synthase
MPALLYRLYESRIVKHLSPANLPHHIGVIVDGNRRWARKSGLANVNEGHRAGAANISNLLQWCREQGIGMVTLWLLSTDNLRRDDSELQPLLAIIADVVDDLAAAGQPWKLRIVGAMDVLPDWLSERLTAAETRTATRTGIEVNIAVGYGGRQEITDAVRSYLQAGAEAGRTVDELIRALDVDSIADHLYTSGQPDPDLVIRTSGEQRLSGFLLWQSAHSEYWFYEADWPDFRRVDFLRALRDYAARHRRFGG